MTFKDDLREVLNKWENNKNKSQCCSSCEEDKNLGFGDDIEACCCRHLTTEYVISQITKLVEGLIGEDECCFIEGCGAVKYETKTEGIRNLLRQEIRERLR